MNRHQPKPGFACVEPGASAAGDILPHFRMCPGSTVVNVLYRMWLKFIPLQLIFVTALIGLMLGVTGGISLLLLRGGIERAPMQSGAVSTQTFDLSPVFTPEVQYWKPWILRWAKEYNIDPNILGTVIQIESCGHYLVNSPAGAQGLFQVMPFHFTEGEAMLDPDTNARRGINYLLGGLQLADGHIGLAMAGYNGGWGVIEWGWAGWVRETRLYYIWGSEIYMDALAGKKPEESAALQDWLNSGGSILCGMAHDVLFPPTPTPTAP
jgi:hypothetical protein